MFLWEMKEKLVTQSRKQNSVILRYYFQLSHTEALLLVTMRTCMYDVCDVCVGSSERVQRSRFVLQ